MVALLGKVLRYIRLHDVLSSTIALLSLNNTIQCGWSWQGCGRCGSAGLSSSGGKAQVVLDCTLHLATLGKMLRVPPHQIAVRNLQNTVGLVSVQ
jgi:hypothetical protein